MIYELKTEEKPRLDEYESLWIGYDEVQVNVILKNESMRVWMYLARDNAVDSSLLPYRWYLDFVIYGACEHRLPIGHIAYLIGLSSWDDPDPTRRTRNRRLIGGQRA